MLMCSQSVPYSDKQRLCDAIERARSSWVTYAPHLDSFRAELRRADGVQPQDVPADMITMNSRFEVTDRRTGQTETYTLVYPEHERLEQGRISALSPMGAAFFGTRAGDEVSWHTDEGPRVAVVQRVLYQPEAAGDHYL